MNRIVLIGNGFDLAHEMETSYNDFINYLWEDILKEVKASDALSVDNDLFKVAGHHGRQGELDKDFPAKLKIERLFKTRSFNNNFFKRIVERQYIDNWVDIEKEYYKNLTEIYKLDQERRTDASRKQLDQLNTDFQQIKDKLSEYLTKVEIDFNKKPNNIIETQPQIEKAIGYKMFRNIEFRDCSEDYKDLVVDEEYAILEPQLKDLNRGNKKLNQLSIRLHSVIEQTSVDFSKEQLRQFLIDNSNHKMFTEVPKEVLRVSFNYTTTEKYYWRPTDYYILDSGVSQSPKSIHIHGSIHEEDKNPIIFGYGDELDDDYLEIEKLDDNRYLENIKSVKYLDRDNYKRLLGFVNSDQYQVVIMGHSCGNSDRTLLNTLFEHDNCVSIKPYYHQKEDGSDNYSDIVRNITRNFNDKQKLRDRVVNKQYCEPLL